MAYYTTAERLAGLDDSFDERTFLEESVAQLKERCVGAALEVFRDAREKWRNVFGFRGVRRSRDQVLWHDHTYGIERFHINEIGKEFVTLRSHRADGVEVYTPIPLSWVAPKNTQKELSHAENDVNGVTSSLASATMSAPMALAALMFFSSSPMHTNDSSNTFFATEPYVALSSSESVPTYNPDMYLNAGEITVPPPPESGSEVQHESWQTYFDEHPFSAEPLEIARIEPEDLLRVSLDPMVTDAMPMGGADERELLEPFEERAD